jgi:hypothetical protein
MTETTEICNYTIARYIDQAFAFNLSEVLDHVNSFNLTFKTGREVGRELRTTHLARQACLVNFLLGVLIGIGENDTVIDERNAYALALVKQVEKVFTETPTYAGLLEHLRDNPEYKRDNYIEHRPLSKAVLYKGTKLYDGKYTFTCPDCGSFNSLQMLLPFCQCKHCGTGIQLTPALE